MDRILKEERNYILQMVKKIRASGANVLLIQKSILRDATTDLSLHYLVRLADMDRIVCCSTVPVAKSGCRAVTKIDGRTRGCEYSC